MTLRNYDEEIAVHEATIAAIKKEQATFEAMTPGQRLADSLHDLLCRYNHTDGCGYMYESWEEPKHSRRRELRRADEILNLLQGKEFKTTYETAVALVAILADKSQ